MADRPAPLSAVRIRRFVLDRNVDVTGVSGTGVVAVGCLFVDADIAVVHWLSEFPTSVVWHSRGMESVEKVHGHGGHTRIVFLDDEVGGELDLYGLIEANLGPVFIPLVVHIPHAGGSIELLDEAMMREHGWVRAPLPILTTPAELTDEDVAALVGEWAARPFVVQVTREQLDRIRVVPDRPARRLKVAAVLAQRLGHAMAGIDPPAYGPNTLSIADEILDALDGPEP